MFRILTIVSCSIALLAATPAPATINLGYFVGTWSCSGTFPSTGKAIASMMVFDASLDGAGVVMRQDDLSPNDFHAAFLWGPAPDGSLVSIAQDSTGSVRRFTSSGWTAQTLLWQSDSSVTPAQRFSYKRVDANTMQVEWQPQRFGTYRVGDTLRCTRR